jgi:N-acetylneuraminate synthase/N,N'-diacetyllegionaminate synthase
MSVGTVRIGALVLPHDGEVVVIAEAGVNHDGDPELAHRLVDVAADAGADAVKFQTFDPDRLVSAAASAAPYQRARGAAADQRSLLESLTLPSSVWAELRDHAAERGTQFLSTPFDLGSAELLVGLGVPALKVSSGELTNTPFLRELAALGVPLLVSTGMGSSAEVTAAVDACAQAPGTVLLHCVSAYPAPLDQCNLRAIPAMAEAHHLPVGWSDHTTGVESALGAVALGASVLEKHVTTDRTRTGPDHAASLEPHALATYIEQCRALARALGDGAKRVVPAEEENAHLVRRSWHAARQLEAGTVLTRGDVVLLRPEGGAAPSEVLVGRTLRSPVEGGAPVRPDDLQGGS